MHPIATRSLAAVLSLTALTVAGCGAASRPAATARPEATVRPAPVDRTGADQPALPNGIASDSRPVAVGAAARNGGAASVAAYGAPVLAASGGTSPPTAPVPGGPATVTAQGDGTVTGTPDTMTIGIGVSTTAPHAADALAQNNSIAAAVQAALRRDGVTAADMATTGLSVQQNWNTSGPAGYAAFDEVTATLHDPAGSGRVIDDALAPAGDAGRLDEVQLTFADSDPLMAAARTRAVQAARAEAAQMAAALGGHLGPLVSLTAAPSPQPYNYPLNYGAAASGAGSSSVPVQPGTQKVTTEVTGVWQVIGA